MFSDLLSGENMKSNWLLLYWKPEGAAPPTAGPLAADCTRGRPI